MKGPDGSGIRIGIVGAGRVGTALSLAFTRAGMEIAGVASRRGASVDRLRNAAGLGPSVRCDGPGMVFERSDVVFLSVGDDDVAAVCRQIVDGLSYGKEAFQSSEDVGVPGPGGPTRVVAHLSGALGSSVLSPLRELGASVASLHPVKSFSDDPRKSSDLAGTVATVEGDITAVQILEQLAAVLGVRTVRIESSLKPLYHAAACIASNYTVTLYALSLALMGSCGIEESVARAALSQLVRGTAQNLADQPPDRALTGPIARGDVHTIRGHLEALKNLDNSRAECVYRILGLETIDLAERSRLVSTETSRELRVILSKETASS